MMDESNIAQEITVQDNVPPGSEPLSVEPVLTHPPIAGFLRRFFAWMVDSLLLGLVGQLVALFFSSLLFQIGPYGRPIGLLFIIPYFGILNSKIGGGQTLGKRLFKIAVRNKNNEPIGLGRSFLRILILALPALFNGWSIPIFQNYIMSWFLVLLVFGLGGAILYTMSFNRSSRQGIHDLLLGTYVVDLRGKMLDAFPTASRLHWVITGLWIGLIAVGSLGLLLIAPRLISKTPLQSVMSLHDVLQDDPRFFAVGVNDQTFHGFDGNTSRSLILTAWYKGKVSDADQEEISRSIAKIVFDHEKNIDQYDGMQIKLTSAYDIGIASGNFSMWFSKSIEDWRKEIFPAGSPNG